ncbi:hypothetical protein STEG23_017618, partial [Scotinomys teguina]
MERIGSMLCLGYLTYDLRSPGPKCTKPNNIEISSSSLRIEDVGKRANHGSEICTDRHQSPWAGRPISLETALLSQDIVHLAAKRKFSASWGLRPWVQA